MFYKFLAGVVVVGHVGQPDVHLGQLWLRIQTTRRGRIKSGGWFCEMPSIIGYVGGPHWRYKAKYTSTLEIKSWHTNSNQKCECKIVCVEGERQKDEGGDDNEEENPL